MNTDEFESRLRRQPARQIPPEWRAEILAATEVNRRSSPVRELAFADALRLRLRDLLWPSPKLWGGLAVVWLAIVAVNFSLRDGSPIVAQKAGRQSPEFILVLQQQQQFMAELMGQASPPAASRSTTGPSGPRSDRREEIPAA